MLDRAGRTAPTRQDELDHTDLPAISRPSKVGMDHASDMRIIISDTSALTSIKLMVDTPLLASLRDTPAARFNGCLTV